MRNYKEINQALIEEGAFVTPRLQKMTFDLIKMVEKDQIESFSFPNQTEISMLDANYITVSISFKKDNENVTLGVFDHLDEFPKAKRIVPEEIFDKLDEMNGYLAFANKHLKQDLPQMRVTTYYSVNAANNLGGFKENPVKNLLPSFMNEELSPIKTKKLK